MKKYLVDKHNQVELTKAEAIVVYHALEELMNSDDLTFGPSNEQLSNLLNKFKI